MKVTNADYLVGKRDDQHERKERNAACAKQVLSIHSPLHGSCPSLLLVDQLAFSLALLFHLLILVAVVARLDVLVLLYGSISGLLLVLFLSIVPALLKKTHKIYTLVYQLQALPLDQSYTRGGAKYPLVGARGLYSAVMQYINTIYLRQILQLVRSKDARNPSQLPRQALVETEE